MSGKIISLIACITLISMLQAFDVQIERPEVHYIDYEYYKYFKISVRRQNRKSPYLVYSEIYILTNMGNNVSGHFQLSVQLFENLSGRYLPTLVCMQWKLCDFFNNEPYFGQLLKQQFPSNLTCPHKAGLILLPAVEVQFEKLPYIMPVTWPFKTTGARADLTWTLTETKRPIAVIYIYLKIITNSGAKAKKTVSSLSP